MNKGNFTIFPGVQKTTKTVTPIHAWFTDMSIPQGHNYVLF